MAKMRLSGLTYEVFQKIVKIYDETVGGHGSRYLSLFDWGQTVKRLQIGRSVEYRFGSVITFHSKLWIRIHPSSPLRGEPFVHFQFDPNADIRMKKDEKLAEELKVKFKQAAGKFLEESGLAVAD